MHTYTGSKTQTAFSLCHEAKNSFLFTQCQQSFEFRRLPQERTFLTTKGAQAGTPAYMASELFSGSHVSEKVDVFSFAVLLWEALTGQIPWDGLQVMQVIYRVAIQRQRLQIPEDAPPWLQDLISRCWRPEPDQRPPFTEIVQQIELQWKLLQQQPEFPALVEEAEAARAQMLALHQQHAGNHALSPGSTPTPSRTPSRDPSLSPRVEPQPPYAPLTPAAGAAPSAALRPTRLPVALLPAAGGMILSPATGVAGVAGVAGPDPPAGVGNVDSHPPLQLASEPTLQPQLQEPASPRGASKRFSLSRSASPEPMAMQGGPAALRRPAAVLGSELHHGGELGVEGTARTSPIPREFTLLVPQIEGLDTGQLSVSRHGSAAVSAGGLHRTSGTSAASSLSLGSPFRALLGSTGGGLPGRMWGGSEQREGMSGDVENAQRPEKDLEDISSF